MSNKVTPMEPVGCISLATLNPDLNGDGKVETWERDAFMKLKALDIDGSGEISVHELFAFIKASSENVGAALAQTVGANIANGGISIKTLDPDMDGDGKVGAFELDMFKRIKSADVDGSGSISVKELFGVIKGAAESDKSKKLFQRLFMVSLLVIVLLSGAMFGVVIMGVALMKDQYASGGVVKDRNGEVVKPGGYGGSATPVTSRNRRLMTASGGRRLVSVATIDTTECSSLLSTAMEAKSYCGAVNVGGGASIYQGCITATGSSETEVSSSAGKATITDCSTVSVAAGRIRELSVSEASEPSRRRHLAARLDDKWKGIREGCVVYHCFEGDNTCDEPSPAAACAIWAPDGKTCDEPLCKYVATDDDKGEL